MSKAPVGHTCPDIDSLIDKLKDTFKDCERAVNNIEREDYESAKSDLRSAIWFLEDFTSRHRNPLEDLRKSNAELRAWGEGLAEDVARLEEEIELLQEQAA